MSLRAIVALILEACLLSLLYRIYLVIILKHYLAIRLGYNSINGNTFVYPVVNKITGYIFIHRR